ncbi:MAG: ABC transporter permease [Polyangiaceae bacterium]|nr:ABC transporter permease [Polyangiaceae bacterium]MCW5791534.1 ABC transporter permease [Polyangiaceae bacterium]
MHRSAWQRFGSNRGAVIGALLVALLVLFALVGPWCVRFDPNLSDFVTGTDVDGSPVGPSAAHLLGVDNLLRDQLSRLAHGARISLAIGFVATLLSAGVGLLVGLVAGWTAERRHGWVDQGLMRLVDVGLSLPYLVLVMALGVALGDVTLTTLLAVLGLTSWFGTARVIRSKVIQLRSVEFIEAARALGQTELGIARRHLLPNVLSTLVVIATAHVAAMIIAESVLSYLQVGLPPPTATWGRMLQEGQSAIAERPLMVVAPGVMILLSVLGFNLLGEGLRDVLDPKHE